MAKSIRHTLLALAIGALPVLAAAQNYPSTTAQQPAATPSASPSTNMQNSTMGKSANSDYGQAIAACEQKPMSERVACRQAADSKFGKGGGGNTQGDAGTSGNATGGTTGTSGTGSSSGGTK